MYVVTFAPTVKVVSPAVKPVFVALWIVKPASLLELSTQVKLTVGGLALRADAVATRFVGAAGTTFVGVTLLEGADAGPVPTAFVAVTVNV